MLYLVQPHSHTVTRWRPAMPIHPELGECIVRAANEDEAYGRALMRAVDTHPRKAVAPAVTETPKPPYQGNAPQRVTPKSEVAKLANELVTLLQSALDSSSNTAKVVRIKRETLAEAFCLSDALATQLEDDDDDSDDDA